MTRLSAALLTLTGIVHTVLGVSAIVGTARLDENVREIETSAVGGDLYFALGTLGLIMTALGVLQFVAAALLFDRGDRARLLGLVATYLAMGVVFWTLPIFRWASAGTVIFLFASAYILTYQTEAEAD